MFVVSEDRPSDSPLVERVWRCHSERAGTFLSMAASHLEMVVTFLQATGMTHAMFRQIERARYATNLLKQGVSILDTVHEADYFDQAHLTRSLRHLIGQTPARIIRATEQLSFLYKTSLTP